MKLRISVYQDTVNEISLK